MQEQKLYANCWQNTGMPNQTIWVYNTPMPDGKLGDAVGDFMAVSPDYNRCYKVRPTAYVEFKGFVYYPEPEYDEEYCVLDIETKCYMFIEHCEDIFKSYAFTDVWNEEVAINMMALSERLGLGWVMEEIQENYEDGWRIYHSGFANKAYIGQDVVFCFDEKTLVEVMAEESITSLCDFKKHDVITMHSDGEYNEDEAYVIIRNKNIVMNNAQKSVIKGTIKGLDSGMADIDAIWENVVLLMQQQSQSL